jgi:outer membrane protein assembly factor BamD
MMALPPNSHFLPKPVSFMPANTVTSNTARSTSAWLGHSHLRTLAWGVLVLVTWVGLSACSSAKPVDHAVDCEKKFKELHGKFVKGSYQTAREGYATFVTSCTGFEFTEQALFEEAESYFQQGDYIESESEFRSFIKEYPNSPRFGEQGSYRVAQSMAKQVGIAARDQSKTMEAIASYEDFLREFSESKYADSAKNEIASMRNVLADKDLQIAKLYKRMGEPQAAAIYYKNLLKEYGDRVDQRDISLKLVQCYIALSQFDEAESYLRKFDGIAKNDPFQARIKSSYSDLEKAREKHAREKKEEKDQSQRRETL